MTWREQQMQRSRVSQVPSVLWELPRLAAWWCSIHGTRSCDMVALPSSFLLKSHLQLSSPLTESVRQEPRAINSMTVTLWHPDSWVKAHVKLRCLCPTQEQLASTFSVSLWYKAILPAPPPRLIFADCKEWRVSVVLMLLLVSCSISRGFSPVPSPDLFEAHYGRKVKLLVFKWVH